ncbi:MAG: hypothetical protein NTZ78_12100 [Candidatus Aureabacteria bacterium]|nr:hypothetical protein [Candidatus Auribacterota bacterium]
MQKLMTVVLGLVFAFSLGRTAVAGSINSPGAPSAGSGLYTLSQIYNYLNLGVEATPVPSFQEPLAAPASTMRTTKEIYNTIHEILSQCDIGADNVESGKKFFSTQPGNWGLRTGTLAVLPRPTATPTVTATPTITPTTTPTATPTCLPGWIRVPGNPSNPTYQETADFLVMKYEAKDVSGTATSQASGVPWTSITRNNAASKCSAIGAHLCTIKEAQTINRSIDDLASNWNGGTVGSGRLYIGHTDGAPSTTLAADTTGDPDDDPYVGTGDSSPSDQRRTFILHNGQIIWDWSGNVTEWFGTTCEDGTGFGKWTFVGWDQWYEDWLDDYEREAAGPTSDAWGSAQGTGLYFGCNPVGSAFQRGGCYSDGSGTGMYQFCTWYNATSSTNAALGFRCCK